MARQKLFSWVKTLAWIYMGQVKELWGTRTLAWQDGVLLKPTQEEIDSAIIKATTNDNNNPETPKRKRKAKAQA